MNVLGVVAQVEIIVVLVPVAAFVVLALLALFMFARVFSPWLRGFLSGAPLSVLEIIGMRLRKTDVQAVLNALVMATQAGAPVSSTDMEQAHLQGADLEKVTLAFIQATKDDKKVTFGELVQADLDNRLRDKLGMPRERR